MNETIEQIKERHHKEIKEFQEKCPQCSKIKDKAIYGENLKKVIGIDYGRSIYLDSRYRYDGVSEWRCSICLKRYGRWTGKVLKEGEFEKRYGGIE